MKITRKAIAQVVEAVLSDGPDAKIPTTARVILDEKTVVRAKRKIYKLAGRRSNLNRVKFMRGGVERINVDISLHLGYPNYVERQIIKKGFIPGKLLLK